MDQRGQLKTIPSYAENWKEGGQSPLEVSGTKSIIPWRRGPIFIDAPQTTTQFHFNWSVSLSVSRRINDRS
jgi:hypothetical protein